MDSLLLNPVYHALQTGDAHLRLGTDAASFFEEAVSPFAGFATSLAEGFAELHRMLPAGRNILYATPQCISEPPGWEIKHEIKGLQFLFNKASITIDDQINMIPLTPEHIEEMVGLAALTKPGPFGKRTILFGNYWGIFQQGKLVAMTGERLHPGHYAELSAVCTQPHFLGKGYAAALMSRVVNNILGRGNVPFLHVRSDNVRAIALYERLGFTENGPMNFYFMRRR